MEIKLIDQSAPVKFVITEKADVIDEKKKVIYEKMKDSIKFDGFRLGAVPQEVAEQRIELSQLYKDIIDEIFFDVQKQYNIVHFKDFKIYGGTFKKGKDLKIEFIGELKPKVTKLADKSLIEMKYVKELKVEEEDIKQAIEAALKEQETLEEAGKEILENLDTAIIDFTGYLEASKEPFKNGSAKNHQVCVNKIVDGHKQFIDTFEDQLVGMKIGETKDVNVKFPDDYRDKTKAGKKARFEVKLTAIKKVVRPPFDDDFAKLKNCESIEAYKKLLEKNILVSKRTNYDNTFKRDIVSALVNQSEISPIPQGMFDNELEKDWSNFLDRIGKTEKEYTKSQPHAKDYFRVNNENQISETIKLSLILEALFNAEKLSIAEEDIKQYVKNTADSLGYDSAKKAKLFKDMENSEQHHDAMKKAAMNERIVDHLFKYFQNK